MKKNLLLFFTLVVSLSFFSNNIIAKTKSFNITTNHVWKKYSTANLKVDTLKTAWVDWQASTKSNHKQWFKLVNSENQDRGEAIFSFLGKKKFSTTAKKGHNYWLMSKREHIGNPITQVVGIWEP